MTPQEWLSIDPRIRADIWRHENLKAEARKRYRKDDPLPLPDFESAREPDDGAGVPDAWVMRVRWNNAEDL